MSARFQWTIIGFISLFLMVMGSGCGQSASEAELKVLNWGPQSKTLGEVPNKQPNGEIGLWIQVLGKKKIDYDVLVDGKPMSSVGGGDNLITAAIPVELTESVGTKDVYVQEITTGKKFFVGKITTNAIQAPK